jgi:hypothetical protein
MSFSRNPPGLFSTHTMGRFQSRRYPVGIRIFVPRAIRSLQDDTLRGLGTQGLCHFVSPFFVTLRPILLIYRYYYKLLFENGKDDV